MQVFYTVRQGDTLQKIADRWSIPLGLLINANNLSAPFTIYPGQQLSMPPAVNTYVVKYGDSVFSISQRYGIPTNIIIEANGIEPPYVIVPGQVLVIPAGVPYYIVRPGDTLYKIGLNFNVTVNGYVKTDYIIQANSGLTPAITPGMAIAVPYPPPGGPGKIAVLLNDDLNSYLGLYDPNTGALSTLAVEGADEASNIFWSPDQTKIAFTGGTGIISVIDVTTKRISKIDQTVLPAFIDWAPDSRRIVYSNGKVIRIYDVLNNTFKTVNRPGASYVQWLSNGTSLLYELKTQQV
jgi:TolB protein